MLTLPYVTTAAFRAHPTYLDLLNLRSGDSDANDQTAELFNILLMASAEADSIVMQGLPNGSLAAHTVSENTRLRADRYGRLLFHPSHTPVVSVESFAAGSNIGALTTYTAPSVWIEDGRQVVVELSGAGSVWSGSLQFGTPLPGCELYTTWNYTAGWPNATLASSASAAATSIRVSDATGIVAGSVLRIWDPGVEESVTVASTYTVGSTTVPLTAGLAYAHSTSSGAVGVSGLPADAHTAVILLAVVLLMRPDSSAEDAYADARIGPDSRESDSRTGGGGLIEQAEMLLAPYRRIR